IEVAFDSQHQRIYLPIDADLSAADEAGLVKSVVGTDEGIAPRRMGKTRTEISADIEAGPIIDRRRIGDRRNWRRHAARRYIGGLRRTNANDCAGGERNAAHEFTGIHARPPASFPTRASDTCSGLCLSPRRSADAPKHQAHTRRSLWTKRDGAMAGKWL